MNRQEAFELPQVIDRYRAANPPLSPRFRQRLRDQLRSAATQPPPQLSPAIAQPLKLLGDALEERTVRIWHRVGLRLAALAVAAVLAATGVLVRFHDAGPTPVSAQSVLDRAASIGLPPNRAIHLVYRDTMLGQTDLTDIWMESNSRGAVARAAGTEKDRSAGTVVDIIRWVDDGRIYRSYEYFPSGSLSTVRKYSVTDARYRQLEKQVKNPFIRSGLSSLDWYKPGIVAQYFSRLARSAPEYVHLLPKRLLDGVSVYPIKVDRSPNWPAMTIYFDAHTYIYRGGDPGNDPHFGITPRPRLVKQKTVPFSAVPPHTFELHIPKGWVIP
jgi:hypothetical protein